MQIDTLIFIGPASMQAEKNRLISPATKPNIWRHEVRGATEADRSTYWTSGAVWAIPFLTCALHFQKPACMA